MEEELFLTGYCRQLDQSRMVTVVIENAEVTECDCCFGSCIYEPSCPIAEQIRQKL